MARKQKGLWRRSLQRSRNYYLHRERLTQVQSGGGDSKQFAEYFGRSPEQMGAEELRRYQLYLLHEKKLSVGTVENCISALWFLYRKTLKRRDLAFDDLPFPKQPRTLPTVLSQEEVTRLIEAPRNLMHRTVLILLYATGARRSEASRMEVSAIDSQRMVIHIHHGKGRRDRDVPLTPKLLEALRQYWRWKKPRVYLFPSPKRNPSGEQPISDKTVWNICRAAARRAGLEKELGPHTLRHCFATHLLEAGADLRTIQLLMGHERLEDTTIYLHLSQRHLHAAINPFDQLALRSHHPLQEDGKG